MSKIIKDVKVVTGTYQNKQGETKNNYQKVGVAFIEGDKISIKLDKTFNPSGVEGVCWLNLYDQRTTKTSNNEDYEPF